MKKPNTDGKDKSFNSQLKLVTGELTNLSEHSEEQLVLLQGGKVVWSSTGRKKDTKKPPAKKNPTGAGRPEKTEVRTTIDELQAMREAKARRAKAQLQSKKRAAAQKKSTGKSHSKAFTIARQAPVARKEKRA